MKISVLFDVKNFVEVMESWPITHGDMSFFLERKNNVVKKVGITFSNISMDQAPTIKPAASEKDAPVISIQGGAYAQIAIMQILNWQAVVSGQQIFDLDFDDYELRFHAETLEEKSQIHVSSYRGSNRQRLNLACDFEQIGRAFCVGSIATSRIESTAHYREGRLAFEAGRYIDTYNNMFLFLETRYCDGKTKTAQQVQYLSECNVFLESLKNSISKLAHLPISKSKHLMLVFDPNVAIKDKIKTIVRLRGKLRHHSLKSPHRWDPNKQNEYEEPARFISSVVADIVIKESLSDIYAPDALKKFRDISVTTGYESKIEVTTHRLEHKPSLALKMSYPTTLISTKICLTTFRNGLEACEKNGQMGDTFRLDAVHGSNDLELFEAELDIWVFSESPILEKKNTDDTMRCRFEHLSSGVVMKHEFEFPIQVAKININYAWSLLRYCFDHIEKKDITTRVLSLKLFLGKRKRPVATYRVGAQVKN
jgi:hypothetical protein